MITVIISCVDSPLMELNDELKLRIAIEGEETEYGEEGLRLGELGDALYTLNAVYSATQQEIEQNPNLESEFNTYLDQITNNMSESGSLAYADSGNEALDPDLAEDLRDEIYSSLESYGIFEKLDEGEESWDEEYPLYLIDAEKYNPFELAVIAVAVVAVVAIGIIAGTTLEVEKDSSGTVCWRVTFSGEDATKAMAELPADILRNVVGQKE